MDFPRSPPERSHPQACEHILLIDPVGTSRAALARRLTSLGFAVDTAADGVEGASAALRSPPCAVIVVSDITESVAQEARDADREEDLHLLHAVLEDREGVRGFVADALAASAGFGGAVLDGAATARTLHTLKGNARMAGFHRCAAVCHRVEDRCSEAGHSPGADDLKPVVACVERLAERARVFLTAAAPALAESTHERMRRVEAQAMTAARAAGKDIVVTIEGADVRTDGERWTPVWSNLVHAVQNAIDHGIEPAAERSSTGKPPTGRLVIRARADAGRVVLEVQDDGRGPAWDRIAARATARGLPAESESDLLLAVFDDGLSTAGQVSATSGRGVGLSALRAAVRAVGGEVSLRGVAGVGTTLRVELPSEPPRAGAPVRRASGPTFLACQALA